MHKLRSDPGRGIYVGLLEALVQVMGMAKGYLFGLGPQVAMLATRLADQLGVRVRERSEILFAAILSDVGMIGLVEEAWENPVLVLPPDARTRVLEHPERISGDRIPMVAQILGVWDTYDGMTSGRVYRAARSHWDAFDEIARSAGTQFGARVVDYFVQLPGHVFKEIWSLEKTLKGWLQHTMGRRRKSVGRSSAS